MRSILKKRGTYRFGRKVLALVQVLFIILMQVVAPAAMIQPAAAAPLAQDAAPPTIQSDLPDYAPGATVTLTGANWQPGEAVRVVVNDTIGQTWQRDVTVNASSSGTIVDVFQLPTYFVSNYDVTASGPSGVATTTFTDLNVGTYDQCANDANSVPPGTGYTSGDLGCQSINGNLQSNTAYYAEGDATVQRVWLGGPVARLGAAG